MSEVKMLGRHADHTSISRGGEYFSVSLPKLKFEIVVADRRVRRTVQAIVGRARTGRTTTAGCSLLQFKRRFAFAPGSEGSLPSEVRLTTRMETTDLICGSHLTPNALK